MLEVLVVDDDEIVRQSVSDALESAGHQVVLAPDAETALALFQRRSFDMAVCDVQLPRMDGLALCRRLRMESPATALVVMTSFGNVPDAVRSLRSGVLDYVSKPFDPDAFVASIVAPVDERNALRRRFDQARAASVVRDTGRTLVGESLVMRRLRDGIARASQSDAPLLVHGERGVGKKLAARLIHAESPRRGGPFTILRCAFLQRSETVAESIRASAGGTLVLDGIEHLSSDATETLVAVLDDPALRARRSHDWESLGVRLITLLTEAAPDSASESPRIPESLRMEVECTSLRVSPLRERDGDLYLLASHYLRELTPPARTRAQITPRAWRVLAAHSFPDNVRELIWSLQFAVARAEAAQIDLDHLPPALAGADVPASRDTSRTTPW